VTRRFEPLRGRRVLVTGHTGFKGPWLSLMLRHLGADVWGFALEPPTEPSMFDVASVATMMQSRIGDVRDADALSAVFAESRPELVVHLAAQSLVRESYRRPIQTYETNVIGTAQVLEACRTSQATRAVLVVTSDKCYEEQIETTGYRESDRLGGRDPYSSSKACTELVASAYGRSFFDGGPTAVASARAGNVIGGGDWAAERLIPDIARAISLGRPVEIRNPGAIRPWQHVLEPLRGYLMLSCDLLSAEAGGYWGAWNFGPGRSNEQPVSSVVTSFIEAWGEGSWIDVSGDTQPHEAPVLRLDSSKALRTLGWAPSLDLDAALRLTAEWYGAFAEDPKGMLGFTLGQIDDYLAEERTRQ
jgi:CDP-glucose 4,6-dehydratase